MASSAPHGLSLQLAQLCPQMGIKVM